MHSMTRRKISWQRKAVKSIHCSPISSFLCPKVVSQEHRHTKSPTQMQVDETKHTKSPASPQ